MYAQYVRSGDTIPYTPVSAVSAGDVVVLGEGIGVAKLDIAAGDLGTLHLVGTYTGAKPTDEAWTIGLALYWDATGHVFTSSSTSATYAGIAGAAAAQTAATGLVILNTFTDPDATA